MSSELAVICSSSDQTFEVIGCTDLISASQALESGENVDLILLDRFPDRISVELDEIFFWYLQQNFPNAKVLGLGMSNEQRYLPRSNFLYQWYDENTWEGIYNLRPLLLALVNNRQETLDRIPSIVDNRLLTELISKQRYNLS